MEPQNYPASTEVKKLETEWIDFEKSFSHSAQLQKKSFLKSKKILIPIFLATISTVIQFTFLKSCNFISGSHSNNKFAVVVSVRDLKEGDTITNENTKLTFLELGEVQSKFILNSEFKRYIGHKLKLDIDMNTPILKNVLINNLHEISLPEKIPSGKRFYAIEVEMNSLSSLIRVGDRVDIVAHMDIEGFGKASETILNGIKVIGIGDDFEEKTSNPDATTLSFYLTPEEVKIITFMKSYSQFSVALRNPHDVDLSDNSPITFNKFIQTDKIQKIFQNDSFKIIEGKKTR